MPTALAGPAHQIFTNLSALGARKLGALALIGVLVAALVGLGSYFLSRPDMETLYSGLDRTDVTRIGATLTEAGIPFDVSAEGDAVLTPFSSTAPARMLLAEKGLPRSENAGYELFDNLGSIGLTSFMQEVTRVRALEGEIARTIQTIQGIRAARVHIVLPDEGSFRRERRQPSASVVIRTENGNDASSAQAIRSLVAAAIPGMSASEVTILDQNGTLLASGEDGLSSSPTKLFGIERIVASSVEDSVRRTLSPYLGIGNFQTSVSARLNTDRQQTSERIFDPEGRVERSTRTIRESGESENNSNDNPVTAEQDVQALDEVQTAGGETSRDANERREEVTNYEINEKTIQTTSDGYAVERLTVAVVVNRGRLLAAIGEGAGDEQVAERVEELRGLIASAAGISEARGDTLTVTAVDFLSPDETLEALPGPGLGEMFMRQSGTLINALTVLAVAGLVIWFGLRPLVRTLAATPEGQASGIEAQPMDLDGLEANVDLGGDALQLPYDASGVSMPDGLDPGYLEDFTKAQANSPKARLSALIDLNEEHAAGVIKQWIHEKKAA